jgi:IS30 family transposase
MMRMQVEERPARTAPDPERIPAGEIAERILRVHFTLWRELQKAAERSRQSREDAHGNPAG